MTDQIYLKSQNVNSVFNDERRSSEAEFYTIMLLYGQCVFYLDSTERQTPYGDEIRLTDGSSQNIFETILFNRAQRIYEKIYENNGIIASLNARIFTDAI